MIRVARRHCQKCRQPVGYSQWETLAEAGVDAHVHTQHKRRIPQETNITFARTNTGARPATKGRAAQYHCEHHGASGTHDTRDCLVLNGHQGNSRERRTQRRDALISASAIATSQQCRWHERRQPYARLEREPRSDRPQCHYCERYGHLQDRYVILHPELAEVDWLPQE